MRMEYFKKMQSRGNKSDYRAVFALDTKPQLLRRAFGLGILGREMANLNGKRRSGSPSCFCLKGLLAE
jgi:hypothetical protein